MISLSVTELLSHVSVTPTTSKSPLKTICCKMVILHILLRSEPSAVTIAFKLRAFRYSARRLLL